MNTGSKQLLSLECTLNGLATVDQRAKQSQVGRIVTLLLQLLLCKVTFFTLC